jgi:hypothetical protein
MIHPAVAANRLLICFLLGCILGICHDLLTPVRQKAPLFGDLLLLPVLLYLWLIAGFRVCRGDLRLGFLAGFLGGAILWHGLFARVFMPIYSLFWQPLGFLLKKSLKFVKFFFASGKKWVTIQWRKRRVLRRQKEGAKHGSKKAKGQDQISPFLHAAQMRDPDNHYFIYGGAADPAECHHPEEDRV